MNQLTEPHAATLISASAVRVLISAAVEEM